MYSLNRYTVEHHVWYRKIWSSSNEHLFCLGATNYHSNLGCLLEEEEYIYIYMLEHFINVLLHVADRRLIEKLRQYCRPRICGSYQWH